MHTQPPRLFIGETKPTQSDRLARIIFFSLLAVIVVFLLFISFVVDEYEERILILASGAVFVAIVLFLHRILVNVIRETLSLARASEALYQSLLENIPTITYINDLSVETRTTYISPQIKDFLGYKQSEFLSDPLLWVKIIHADDRERVLAENTRTSETLDDFNIEYRLITKSGKVVWAKDKAIVVFDENHHPQYWLGVWSDITSIKESEKMQAGAFESLTRRTNQLQTASEVSRAATSILELDELLPEVVELIRGHFDYYYVGVFLADEKNETLILGAATGEMGKQMLDLRHSLAIGNSSMVGWCVANNQARIALDVGKDAVHFKNPLLPLSRSELALPLRSRGRVIGAMTIQSERESAFTESDITVLQTMTDQVANAIETARLFNERVNLIKELEAKNAELEQFAYTVSHDLKSPLVTIRGFLGYLKDYAYKGDFDRFDKDLNRVVSATTTMQTLLNDLLMLSKVGRTPDSAEDVNVYDVISETLELIHSNSLDGRINVKMSNDLPEVHMNRTRAGEVIQNLLTNAVKFSGNRADPCIEIGFDGYDDTNYATLFVRDNGIGIDPKYHVQVFGLFNRLNPEIEGTGVGLTLVKRIVESYGGHIWLHSEGAGKGSIFYFTLPCAANTDGE